MRRGGPKQDRGVEAPKRAVGCAPPQTIFFISSSVNGASFIGTGAVELAGARARQISVSGGTGVEHKLIGAVVAVATARPTTIIIPSPRGALSNDAV